MNILYITMAERNLSSGVYKKICSQVQAFCEFGNKCNILFLKDTSDAVLVSEKSEHSLNFVSNSLEIEKIVKSADVCYFRFELLRHKWYKMVLEWCKKNSIDVITEIPTYPPYQESLARAKAAMQEKRIFSGIKTLIGSLFVIKDTYRMANISKIMCLVADDKKFKMAKTIRIENGIDLNTNKYYPGKAEHGKIIRIIAVSNFAIWNGYDRAIQGLFEYIKKTGNRDVRLVFVGDINKAQPLKRQCEVLGLTNNIEFTGALSGKELDYQYSIADVALGALGNHRRKVFANSSLKAKEYTARGKIMILSDAEGIESEIKKRSFLVKSNEDPMDFVQFIDWYNKINNYQEYEIKNRIFAEKNYAWDRQMKKVIDAYMETRKSE